MVGPPETRIAFQQLIAGPPAVDMLVGEASTVSARLIAPGGASIDPNQFGIPIEWTSANQSVVTVDRIGRIAAVAPGLTSVIAKYDYFTAQATVRVTARPSRIQFATASLQGSAGQAVPGGVGVQILDAEGRPVVGLPVRFTILVGEGSVSPSQVPTGSDGRASTGWTLGRTAGRNALEIAVLRGGAASAPSAGAVIGDAGELPQNAVGDPNEVLASTIVFADVTGATPTRVVLTPASAGMRGGESRVFAARVVDQFGNDAGNQAVTFGSSNSEVLAVNSAGAVAARRVGTASVTASSTYAGVEGSATVTVTPGPLAQIVKISGDGQAGPTGSTLPQPLVVEVQDGGGNPLSGVPLTWTVSGGSLTQSSTTTDAAGRAQTQFTLGPITGTYTISAAHSAVPPVSFTAIASSLQPTITTSTLANGTVGVAYSQGLGATGGSGSYSWSLTSGALPAGLSLTPGGAITGTPTTAGTSIFIVQVSSGGLTASRSLSITIGTGAGGGVVVLTSTVMQGGAVGQAYNQTLTATGGDGTYTWALTFGSLPAGLSLDASTGAITGTPTTPGLSVFTAQATSAGLSGSKPLQIAISTAGDAEPLFNAGAQTMVMSDNMDAYVSATVMGLGGPGPRIIPNPSPAATSQPVETNSNEVIAPGRGGAGNALRMLYDGQYQSGSNFETLNTASLTDNNDTHYLQYWARVTYPGGSPAVQNLVIAIKWLMAWHRVSSGTRIQWETHDGFPCNAGPGGSDPLPYGTYWGVFDQAETGCQAFQPRGPFFFQIADGNWHRFTYEFKPNSSAGSRDGFARMWVDGTKVIDVSGAACGVTPPGGLKPWCALDDLDALAIADGISFLRWGGVHTGVAVQPWTYDIDDFSWWVTP